MIWIITHTHTQAWLVFSLQGPNKIPADIVFIVRQKSHPLYARLRNDLTYRIQISLEMVRRYIGAKGNRIWAVFKSKTRPTSPAGFDRVLCGCGDAGREADHHSHQRYRAVGVSPLPSFITIRGRHPSALGPRGCLLWCICPVFQRSPDYKKVVAGEGMPLSHDASARGNLVIAFDIQFPEKLAPESKQLIKQALSVKC